MNIIAACDYKSTKTEVGPMLVHRLRPHPVSTIRRFHVDPMLVHRLRRWPKIGSTQGQRIVPAGVGQTLKQKWLQVV